MNPLLTRPGPLLWLVALLCLGAVGAALVSQYHYDMRPCPWCTFQRLIFLLIGGLALLGAVLSSAGVRLVIAVGGMLLAAGGVAAALWQHHVAAATNSCNLTLADRIMTALGLYELAPDLFGPTATCAEAAVDLLGVPYAYWSLAMFALCGLLCVQVLRVARY
jgi:protein dithiol:quinone oxidoreductase